MPTAFYRSEITTDSGVYSYIPVVPPRADDALPEEGLRIVLRHGGLTGMSKILVAPKGRTTPGWVIGCSAERVST